MSEKLKCAKKQKLFECAFEHHDYNKWCFRYCKCHYEASPYAGVIIAHSGWFVFPQCITCKKILWNYNLYGNREFYGGFRDRTHFIRDALNYSHIPHTHPKIHDILDVLLNVYRHGAGIYTSFDRKVAIRKTNVELIHKGLIQ